MAKYEIEKFGGNNNFTLWQRRMKDLLIQQKIHKALSGKSKMPETMKEAEWEEMDETAASAIRLNLSDEVLNNINVEDCTTAEEIWKRLEELYMAKNLSNKLYLKKELYSLRMSESTDMLQHLSKFNSLISQLLQFKVTFDDEDKAILLLASLPSSYENLMTTLLYGKDTLKFEQVSGSLLSYNKTNKVASNESQALVTENRGRNKGRMSRPQNDKSRGRSKSRGKDYACYHCGKPGHMKKNCRVLKREQGNQKKEESKNTTAPVTCSDEDVAVVVEECLHVGDQMIEWVVDTAASYHATPNRELFSTYKTGDFGYVKMGNTASSNIAGIGDICIQTNVGYQLMLKDVRHVPDLRLNLMSGIALDKEGFQNYFGNGRWKLTKGTMVVARGEVCCTLYKTPGKICKNGLNIVADSSPNLWHRRLGHMSEKGLQILAKKNNIPFAKGTILDPCDYCLLGKQHRVSFSSKSTKKSEILELVYSDVCGPIEVESLGGYKYFVTFIDDASRKTWVYLLKSKDQVFQNFQQFHAMVERETGKPLKCLRTDNGGEYISHEFKEYCSKHGIRHEKTVPGTPQHNGVAERMNRTIVEKVRCMLRTAKLPKSFWGAAVLTACYLINRSPSAPLGFDVPEKVWTCKEISYNHLKVFGCKAFIHVPKEQRSKLDDKALPCIFIGYGNEEFGYKVWDPKTRKVIRSRDVIFHEDQTMKDSNKEEQQSEKVTMNITINPPLQFTGEEDAQNEGDIPEAIPDDSDEESIPSQEHDDQGEQFTGQENEQPQLRRSNREHKPSTRYPSSEYLLLTDGGEPESFQEAQTHKDRGSWMKAMQEEMESIQKNNTYELVKLPKGRKALRNKWVYKLKKDGRGDLVKYKARLVVKGFGQKKGIDFDEIFSPVVKLSSIRIILGLATNQDLEIEQLDVKTAFLHGDLEEEIYMQQPEGFEDKRKEDLVCKLKKSLYGLKQAPRQWYKKFDSFMMGHGYRRTAADYCVYFKRYPGEKFIILLLYVDDMLIVGQDRAQISKLKEELAESFEMKDLGPAKQILGMEITRDRKNRRLWLSQERYVERILERFNMKEAKPVTTPLGGHYKLSKSLCPSTEEENKKMVAIPYSSAVGSLMYAMVCTRPDIAHAVGVVSRFLSNPGKQHWEAVKWIFRYLRRTFKLCLSFGREKLVLEGYTDADMAGDLDGRKSTSGYLFTFAGGAVSWQSKLQKCVALSTTEAEYIAVTEAGKELVWIKTFFKELGMQQDEYVVYCDSQSAIDLSKNATYHSRTKHIEVRYHWIRDATEEKRFKLKKIHTDKNAADMMTKVIPKQKMEFCSMLAGMESC